MQQRSIHLIPITELETEVQLAVREIRNEPSVRKAMFTDHVIGVNEHLQWINCLKTDASQIVFGVIDADSRRPLGVISINALDPKNKRASWGFYLSPTGRAEGLGTALELELIELAFRDLGLEKLNAEVIEGSNRVVKFYKRFHFEEEGFRKAELLKDGKRVGVHLLGLQKNTWIERRSALLEKYNDVLERFTVEVHWSPETKPPTPIDQIEAARARNNVNWMNILRIAVEKSPTNAKQIIAEIREIDQQISSLTQQISVES